MHLFTIMFLLVSMALVSCRGTAGRADQKQELSRVAGKTLGPENVCEANASGTFALCQQKPGADHSRRQYRFAVVRLSDMAIVHEGTFGMGYVKWLDDASIELYSGSPSIREEDGARKIIHVNLPIE